MNPHLQELKRKNWLWSGFNGTEMNTRKTGYPTLDDALEGGFPEQGVIDIKTPLGIGELRLLTGYLSKHTQQRRLALIAPPYQIYGHFWLQQGISLSQLLVVKTEDAQQALWSAEQCLSSGCCASVVVWQDALEVAQIRRLMLASEKGLASIFLLRKSQQQTQFSLPVSMGLSLSPVEHGLQVVINKQRGGRSDIRFDVDMHSQWPQLTTTPAADNVISFLERKHKAYGVG